jgi:ABC-2 type transport system permease protein
MLWAKFCGTYIMRLFYSLVFMIPGVIVHLQYARPNLIGFVFTLTIPVVLGLLSLVFSCLTAYVVFAVSSRIRNKNLLTVLLSTGLLASYYILYEKSQDIFAAVLENAAEVALWTKRLAYPFYQMGLGAQGNVFSMAVFCGEVVLIVTFASYLLWAFYRRAVRKQKMQQN